MRILHTSDWHLGQTLLNYERAWEHQCFLGWLADTIVAEQADVLLVAGDVFDTANPSSAAQRQLYGFLQAAKARAPWLQTVIIAGNHDSPGRLEAPGPLLDAHDVTVVGQVRRTASGEIDLDHLLVPLRGRDGATRAWCMAVPFLRPGDVPRLPDGAEGDPYLGGIALLYRQLAEAARARVATGEALIAMGHCHMVNSQSSADSERRIVIGGTDALPAAMFDADIAYVALGHLHLAQRVGQQERLRYSGSPLPLSFSEVRYQHQVLRVDLEGANTITVTALPVPRPVPLLRVPEQPAPLPEVLAALAALALEEQPLHAQPYLEVRVQLDGPEPGLRAQIDAAIAGKPVRLAKIDPHYRAQGSAAADDALTLDQLAELQPDEVFRRLYQQRFGEEAPADQLDAFAELLLGHGQEAA